MERKEGKYPVNARVDVDYTGSKPKIKFGYTTNNVKKQARQQNLWGELSYVCFIIFLFSILAFYELNTDFKDYPKECNVSYYMGNFTKNIYAVNLTCDTGNHSLIYNNEDGLYGSRIHPEFLEEEDNTEVIVGNFIKYVLPIILSLLISLIVIRTNWYKNWYPIHQARTRRKKYYKFKKDDVENNLVEIPCFSNVELDYKTKGDFSKYLTNIKIREHKWHPYKKEKKKWIIKKLKRDNYSWYARFYFSKKPTNGFLEVIYQ
jgi:hypothetical protein